MDIWRSLGGMVCLEITVADPGQFLSELNTASIPLEKILLLNELTVQLQVKRRYFREIRRLAEIRGGEFKILGKKGLYWNLCGLLKRPVLMLGIAFLLTLTLFLPTRLLFFRVEGNVSVPSRQIIALAEEHGLEFGAIRRDVRSETVKNALLKAIPELEWVGINTAGCVATISVRERQQQNDPINSTGVSNIVAAKNGIVRELIVTAGNGTVHPGQEVKEGQILISGYTDCGLTIRAERAKGEIYATTEYLLTLVFPEISSYGDEILAESRRYALIFGKNRINFSESSGILDGGCVKMYEEKYMTLPGGYILPIGIAVEYYISFTPTESDTPTQEILTAAAERYLQSRMIAGSVISREEEITQQEGIWYLEGKYVCLEMIGKEQSEEIIIP